MSIKINNILSAFTNNLSSIKIPYNGSINDDALKYLTIKVSEAWGQNNPIYAQTGNIVKNENNILALSSTLADGVVEKGNRVEIEGQTTSWNIQHFSEDGDITATLYYEKDSTSNYVLELISTGDAAITEGYTTSLRPPWYTTYGDKITSVIIQDDIIVLGDYLFADHKNLQRVSLSTTITNLGENVFQGCENLQKIELSSAVTHLGANVFKGCNKLVICAKTKTQPENWNSNWNSDNCKVIWSFSNSPTLINGQYYRIELSDSVNYGVGRYISAPIISLSINSGYATFTYEHVLEPLLSVEFQLLDKTNNLVIETSGEIYASYYQTNNYKTDISYQFYNYFKNTNNNNDYEIKALYTTQSNYHNFLTQEANASNILQVLSDNDLPNNIEFNLDIEELKNSGVIKIELKNKINRENEISYKIYKQEITNQTDIYSVTELQEGKISTIGTITYYDLNVSYGIKTHYVIMLDNQAYRKSLNAYIQYEDIFLSDKDNILKIKFNPKISNYKNFLQESKIDTIGNTYPIFARNQAIQYKIFNIEGLLSSESEVDILSQYRFNDINLNNTYRKKTPQHSGTEDDISNDIDTSDLWVKERLYREKVFAWLNNGKPKLFKSPSENNTIVRLLNINLTPVSELGRKIYSFSCQAIELDSLNTINCQKYNLV